MDKQQLYNEILSRWLAQEEKPGDLAQLQQLMEEPSFEDALPELLRKEFESMEIVEYYSKQRAGEIAETIVAKHKTENDIPAKPVHRVHLLKTAWFKYAAAILLVLAGAATYFFIHTPQPQTEMVQTTPSPVPSQIQPGSDRAILTLSDGRQVVLNDSVNEFIADGKTSINKNNGVLTYNAALTSDNSTVSYNTMNTPRGGQYQLVLPDGSQVWLNSASSLRYPTAFPGKTREVELTGEGYFEIKEDKQKPFIVKTKKADVTVLGTGFNVNAYDDEPVLTTTLVYGSVKVSKGRESMVIRPNQQVVISGANSALQLAQPDMEEVLAWKEGKFKFQGATIQTIMRQIARWYDVEVIYNGDIPSTQFGGSLLRKQDPLLLLDALTLTDQIYFKIEGKKIIVNKGPKP